VKVTAQLRVVIVEDDRWKREGMRTHLDAMSEIEVLEAIDQDAAASWPTEQWTDVEAVLVDIFDDRGPGELGSDLYSGINVVERVRRLPVKCIAVTPSCAHPLVQLRLHQAEPDYCYHRFQLQDLAQVAEALRFPDRKQRVADPDTWALESLGARKLVANDVVRTYLDSALAGRIHAETGLKHLVAVGISRREIDRFKKQVVHCGFEPAGHYEAGLPRWPVVRTLILRLLGRLDAPWSEFDKPWWS